MKRTVSTANPFPRLEVCSQKAIGHGLGRIPTTSGGHFVKSHGPSLPLLLFVCFLPSSSLFSYILPAPIMPGCIGPQVGLLVQVTEGEDLDCKCVCQHACVSTLSYLCTVHVTVAACTVGGYMQLLFFDVNSPLEWDQNCFWQTMLLRTKKSKPAVKWRILTLNDYRCS